MDGRKRNLRNSTTRPSRSESDYHDGYDHMGHLDRYYSRSHHRGRSGNESMSKRRRVDSSKHIDDSEEDDDD